MTFSLRSGQWHFLLSPEAQLSLSKDDSSLDDKQNEAI